MDEVFEGNLALVFDDLRTPIVAEVLLDLAQFPNDYGIQHLFRTQNLQVPGNLNLDILQLLNDLLLLHAGEALELQLNDRLRLPLTELEGGNQSLTRFARNLRRANNADYFV